MDLRHAADVQLHGAVYALVRGLLIVVLCWSSLHRTAQQVSRWRDPAMLWRAASIASPHKPRIWINLAVIDAHEGRLDLAQWELTHAITLAPSRPPQERDMTNMLAVMDLARLQTWRFQPSF